MMKLPQDDIQFIDTYLKNSDILFTDVRAEMVDHIASNIEEQIQSGDNRSFYDIFKDYMVEHKKVLQKNYKQFRKQTDKKIGVELLRQIFSLKAIILFIIIFSTFRVLKIYLGEDAFQNFISYLPYGSLVVPLLFFAFHTKEVKYYSAIRRLSIYYLVFYQIVNIFSRPFGYPDILYEMTTNHGVVLIITFLMATVILLFITTLKYKREYQLRYSKC